MLLTTLALAIAAVGQGQPDWYEPFPAHKIIGNVFYVGSKDLATFLVTTREGHILINSGFERTVPLIQKSVESLGFKMTDVKILLESHAHSDHVAGHALLQKLSGAKVYVMRGDDQVIASGGKGQYLYTTDRWEPCKVDRVLDDRDEVKLGDVTLVARLTPGHTRGCTTWTWRVEDGGKPYDVVVIGSPNVNPGFRLVNNEDYPEIAADFAKTFEILKSLPCDVFLGAHGGYYGMVERYDLLNKGHANVFVNPEGYKEYVAQKEQAFRQTLALQQRKAAPQAAYSTNAVAQAAADEFTDEPGIMLREFIYETAPFPECHASTIVETQGLLVAAWFGGTREQNEDVGVWLSRHVDGRWSAPTEVANGIEQSNGARKPVRYPTWNPVLFQPKTGPLLLFYKVGPSPRAWWGMVITSPDGGKTWSKPCRLPVGILGPIKNKPIELASGELLCPSSTESDDKPSRWQIHFERSRDLGNTWVTTGPVNDGTEFSAIQPSILVLPSGKLQAVGRTRQGQVFQIASDDGGKTWGKMTATSLPNPNSGIDAVTLRDGRHLIVYNHTQRGRSPLNAAVSHDGTEWEPALVLENQPGEYSYPAVIQAADGLVHVTYTWQRKRVRHVVIDPAKLAVGRPPSFD